jgi:hypothetical protein
MDNINLIDLFQNKKEIKNKDVFNVLVSYS